jgi:cytochrome c5
MSGIILMLIITNMKKLIIILAAISCSMLFTALISVPATAQTSEQTKTPPASIPANVSKVLSNSCVHCHMEPGNTMALSHVNLSKWDSYDPEKQAAKAAAMNKKLTKGKMPPKGYRADHPDKIPTAADIKVISDWAKSLQPEKK